MLEEIYECVIAGHSFAFETTLSDQAYLKMVLTPVFKALQIDSLPSEIELAAMRCAIPEIQVN